MRWRQDYYLFIIGSVAFSAATIGYLHRRHHRPGDTGHIAGMGTAYVAMLTAFCVDNGPHLPLWDHLPTFAFWLLPSVIGAPIIARAVARARRARQVPHYARASLAGRAGQDRSHAVERGGHQPVVDPGAATLGVDDPR
jgi:hypothetical protein